MKTILPLLALTVAAAPVDHPRTYLLSVVDVPLGANESMESFSLATWGVEFSSVCRIPGGWRIKAGSSATPNGELAGEGSQGATWFRHRSPPELRSFVLITLYGPIQKDDVRNGPDATFKGKATISTDSGERVAPLTYKNVRLTPAARCPQR